MTDLQTRVASKLETIQPDQASELATYLIDLAKSCKYNAEETHAEFMEYLQSSGATEEMMQEGGEAAEEAIALIVRQEAEPARPTLNLARKDEDNTLRATVDASALTVRDQAEAEASATTKKRGKKGKAPAEPKVSRKRGWDLYFDERKTAVRDDMEKKFLEKNPGETFEPNWTSIQKAISAEWKAMSEEDKAPYNNDAREHNEKHGILPKVKQESEKRAMSAYQRFVQENSPAKNDEIKAMSDAEQWKLWEQYRPYQIDKDGNPLDDEGNIRRDKDGNPKKDVVQVPKLAMKLLSLDWGKMNATARKPFQEAADRYNVEKGRKVKADRPDTTDKTGRKVTDWMAFCQIYGSDHPRGNQDWDSYKAARSNEWKRVKGDKALHQRYIDEANSINKSRGIPIPGAAATATATS